MTVPPFLQPRSSKERRKKGARKRKGEGKEEGGAAGHPSYLFFSATFLEGRTRE